MSREIQIRRLAKRFAGLMGVRLLAIGLVFVQTILLTRVFGSEVFGQLSFAISISALAVVALSAGFDQLLMRDIARVGPHEVARTWRWLRIWRTMRTLVAPTVIAIALLGAGVFLFTDLAGGYALPMAGVMLMLPVFLARKLLEAIALGARGVARSLISSQIVYPLFMALGALALWLVGGETGTLEATLVYGVAMLGSLCVAFVLIGPILARIRKGETRGEEAAPPTGEDTPLRQLFSSGLHFSIVALGILIGQHMAVLVTGVLAGPEEVAMVRIASRVAEMAAMLRAIAVLQYRPLLAEAFGQGDKALLQAHASMLAIVFCATGLPITAGLWIFAEEAMAVFGPEFVDGAWAMRIYVLSVFFTMLCGPSNAVLAMADAEKTASQNLMMMVGLQLVLDLMLIPFYGALGAAIAQLVSMALMSIWSAVMTWRKVGVDPSILSAPAWLKGRK